MEEDNHFDYDIVYYKLKKWFKENQFDIPQLLEDFYRHACDMNKANNAMIEAEDEGNEGAIWEYEIEESVARDAMLKALKKLLKEIKELD